MAGTLCDQRQAGNAQEHSWLSLLACCKQISDVQGRKVLMHEEARLKYIYIAILDLEYAKRISLEDVPWGNCPCAAAAGAVLSMQLDC